MTKVFAMLMKKFAAPQRAPVQSPGLCDLVRVRKTGRGDVAETRAEHEGGRADEEDEDHDAHDETIAIGHSRRLPYRMR